MDGAVLGDVGIDRLGRIGRRRREHQRVGVDELRAALVVRAEGELRGLAGREIEPEQLLVAAHALEEDDRLAVRRPRRRVVGELVLREVDDLLRLEVDGVDVVDDAARGRERDQLAVRRDVRRLRRVHRRHRDADFDLARDDVLQQQRSVLFRADEVREPIALRRPRHQRHGVETHPRERNRLEAEILVEAVRQVADDRAVLGGEQQDVELAVALIAAHRRDQIARRRRLDRQHVAVAALLRARREIASVVGRALLVAERLEALLQVAIELLIPFVRVDVEGFLERVVAAADDALAQREHELPHAFLAPARLDELERGVTEVVNQPRVAGAAVTLQLRHLRHDVGDGRVAHRHQVDRAPDAGHVVRHALEHPQRHVVADERGRDDVVLELVRQLVDDEPVEQIRRFVHRHDDAVAARFGERADAFLRGARSDVLLIELTGRRKQNQRHLEGEVVLQLGADVLIGAFGVAGDLLELRLDLRVVVNLEVVGRVDLPLEVVVADLVLAEVRHVLGLGRRRRAPPRTVSAATTTIRSRGMKDRPGVQMFMDLTPCPEPRRGAGARDMSKGLAGILLRLSTWPREAIAGRGMRRHGNRHLVSKNQTCTLCPILWTSSRARAPRTVPR